MNLLKQRDAARQWWARLIVKAPATPPGAPAVGELIGRRLNTTRFFSIWV